ncbi:hypothetical protein ACJJTC_005732 [Scirpophaga incertulas]
MSSYKNFVCAGTQQFSSKGSIQDVPKENAACDNVTSEKTDIRDSKSRRIITKEFILGRKYQKAPRHKKKQLKQMKQDNHLIQMEQTRQLLKQKETAQVIQNHLKAAEAPINLDKASRIMAKMGWRGGALGKTGLGITEPIVAHTAYARSTAGLGVASLSDFEKNQGQLTKSASQPPAVPCLARGKAAQRISNQNFRMIILDIILKFVQNDYEIEIMFDPKLSNIQRMKIHKLVADLGDYKRPSPYARCEQVKTHISDTFYEIRKHNTYLLCTQSEGEGKNRSLCLYKDAPEYMYLITHHDLREDTQIDYVDLTESLNSDEDSNQHVKDKYSNEEINNQHIAEVCSNTDTKIDLQSPNEETNQYTDEECSSTDTKIDSQDPNEIANQTIDVEFSNTDTKINAPSPKEVTNQQMNKECSNTIKKINSNNINEKTNEYVNAICSNIDTKIDSQTTGNKANRHRNFPPKYKKPREPIPIRTRTTNVKKPLPPKENKIILCDKETQIRAVILEYFLDFCNNNTYTDFKFLGAFKGPEVRAIDAFIKDVWNCVNNEQVDDNLSNIIKDRGYKIGVRTDYNGSAVIYKVQRVNINSNDLDGSNKLSEIDGTGH